LKQSWAGGDKEHDKKDISHLSPNQLVCRDLGKAGLEVEQVLDILLPPLQWVQDDVEMRQTVSPFILSHSHHSIVRCTHVLFTLQVSSKPATRLDVINLREQLNMRLETRQARPTGICLIRHELYNQCFGMSRIYVANLA
jgi:dynein light intermediate chain